MTAGRQMRQATRSLVIGVGVPWAGDLDFGPAFVREHAAAAWPPGVALLEGALAAHRLLHEIVDHRPALVVFVGAYPRGQPAGTVRRYRADGPPPEFDEVQQRLGESAGGVIDLDHTLAVTRFYEVLPEGSLVLEVEPLHDRFGAGLSQPVRRADGEVLALLRAAVGSGVG